MDNNNEIDDLNEELDLYLLENILSKHQNLVKKYNLGSYIDLDGNEIEHNQNEIENDENFPENEEELYTEDSKCDFEKLVKINNLIKENENIQSLCDSLKTELIKQLGKIHEQDTTYNKLISETTNIQSAQTEEKLNKHHQKLSTSEKDNPRIDLEKRKTNKGIWTPEEQLRLLYAIKEEAITKKISKEDKILYNKIELYETKLQYLLGKFKLDESKKLLKERYIQLIKNLKKKYQHCDLKELISENENQIDWMKISLKEFNEFRTSEECQSIWERCLHPKFNISEWNHTEERKLLLLIDKYKEQNWDSIAKELNTGRSSYACFTHYNINLKKRISIPWTKEEEEKLKKLVVTYTFGNSYTQWPAISAYFPNRTKHKIYLQWHRIQKKLVKLKKNWSLAEDITLLSAMRFVGPSIGDLAPYLSHREYKQIARRWRVALSNIPKRSYYTIEDDEDIWIISKKYNFKFEKILLHFPEFSRKKLLLRLKFLKKFINPSNGNLKLGKIPRQVPRTISFYDKCLIFGRKLIRRRIYYKFIYKKIETFLRKHSSSNFELLKKLKRSTCEDLDLEKAIRGTNQILRVQYKRYYDSQNSITLSPGIVKEQQDLTNYWLNILQADLNMHNELQEDELSQFKGFEKDILTVMKTNNVKLELPLLRNIPPNYASIVGFRSLLLTQLNFNDNIDEVDEYNKSSLSNKVLNAKNLLLKRMRLLFTFPAFMTAISPKRVINYDDFQTPILQRDNLKTYSKKIINIEAENENFSHLLNENSSTQNLGNSLQMNTVRKQLPNIIKPKIIYLPKNEIQNKIAEIINQNQNVKTKIVIINKEVTKQQRPLNLEKICSKIKKTYSGKLEKSNEKNITPQKLNEESILLPEVNKKKLENFGEINLLEEKNEIPSQSSSYNIEEVLVTEEKNSQSLFFQNEQNTREEEKDPLSLLFQDVKNVKNSQETKIQNKRRPYKKRKAPIQLLEKQRSLKKQRLENLGIEEPEPKPKRTYVKTGYFKKAKVEGAPLRTSKRLSSKIKNEN